MYKKTVSYTEIIRKCADKYVYLDTWVRPATKCLYYLNGGEVGKLGWEDCKGIVQDIMICM